MTGRPLPLYEQEAVRQATGDTVRPGGLGLTGRAVALCSLPAQARILDVACGTGASVEWLRRACGFRVTGVDASELMLQAGRQRCPGLPVVRGLSQALPLAGGRFEAVLVECSLSLMPGLEGVLQEFTRVLQPGGYLIASDLYLRDAQGAEMLRRLPQGCCLKGARSQPEWRGLLEDQGFTLLAWEDHSDSLKHLTAQILLAHSSMQEFWCKTLPQEVDLFGLQLAIARARPGYFLLAAKTPAPCAR